MIESAAPTKLDLTFLDILLQDIETRDFLLLLPWSDAAVEDVLHFFESEAFGLGRCEKHVDKGDGIEHRELGELLDCENRVE